MDKDIQLLINSLVKYFEGNFECMISLGDSHINLITDQEVFVVSITKELLEDYQ